MVKSVRLFFLSLLIFLSFANVSSAASPERILDFRSEISISKSSEVDVKETIVYDFGAQERHGVFRDIPFRYENKDGKKFEAEFKLLSVTDEEGTPYTYKTSTSGDNKLIKIGDPNRTITGIHTYVIEYKLLGVVTYFSDHDEFFWNITGNEWEVPINSASANITFDFPISDSEKFFNSVNLICFTGVYGSKDSNCSFSKSDDGVVFSAKESLSRGEGLTAVISVPKGFLEVYEPKSVQDSSRIIGVLVSFWFLLAYVLLPIYFIFRWFKYGRDPKIDGIKFANFDLPVNKTGRKLTPIELGTLVDEVLNPRDISAEIINLAIKKYLKIKKHDKRIFGLVSGDVEFMKGEAFEADPTLSNLSKHEQDLFNILFTKAASSVKVSSLKNKKSFHKGLERLTNDLYDHMVKDGFFPENPDKLRKKYLGWGIASFFFFGFPLGIILIIMSRIMPRKTLFGAQVTKKGLGLREFLVTQERQFKFQEEKLFMFEKLLPYAIAFGVADIWAGKFSDIVNYRPDWYEGVGGAYTTLAITNSLNNSLSSVQSSFKPTPTTSSSGFSSGFSGGFSGGGFGGGGGGSW